MGKDKYGQSQYSAPIAIMCDYGLNDAIAASNQGSERNARNTFWTEYAGADIGDFIIVGASDAMSPLAASAQQILNVINYGNTFNRAESPDFALITE
ncbi:hypothetical protein [Leclercia sp.]|uniref:hypothetical protein n=1 Tax=Leclercia sp. TaxID=1898428 RepID=UPI0028AF6351|nr:hypothetical protein [Leclercia sp.]